VGRRGFLKMSAAAGAGVVTATEVTSASAWFGDTPFTLGVASGDPTPHSVVLWTRLAPDPTNGGGMPGLPVLVRWRVATDHRLRRVVRHGLAIAWPWLAHSVHVEVDGLDPDRWYFYQFSVGPYESPLGRTRTVPRRDAMVAEFRFAFASCQDWQNGFYTAYRHLAEEDLDLVVHLGDYIYESGPNPFGLRQHDGPELESLASYRNRYALYRTDPHLQAAHAAFPWLTVPDDHEVDNNYAGAISQENAPTLTFLPRRANAYRAYYEHMPVSDRLFPMGPSIRAYRGLTFGRLVRFNALDTRQYRTDQPCGDSIQLPCAGQLDSQQTMMGPAQEAWLLDRLGRSPARWNVIAQQTMLAKFDFLPGTGEIYNMDQWDGYPLARARITSALEERQVQNAIVLTGDIHSSWVHDLKADFADEFSATVGVEFIGTSISSNFPEQVVPLVQFALGDNPHTKYFEGLHRGYVRCTVTPELWRTDFRGVDSILTDQAGISTLASFVVEDGRPGALSG
jgi:alkaline phosphatase D